MLTGTYSRCRRIGSILVAGMVLVSLLAKALPARATVVLLSFEAVPGNRAGEVIVRWETASETGMVGFRVARNIQPSLQTAGTVAIVPNRGSAITGAAYEIVDEQLTTGQIYYYWLLELDDAGQQNVLIQEAHVVAPGDPLATHHYRFPLLRRSLGGGT